MTGDNYKKMRPCMQRGSAADEGKTAMTLRPRPLVAGNWKMNGLRKHLAEAEAICKAVSAGAAGNAEVLICPPATLLASAAAICERSPVGIGGQDCHCAASGAFTGDISAAMLKDAGASYVILGHSERRIGHEESSALVAAKAEAALEAGLTAILCVGETRAEREAGKAQDIVGAQLSGSIPGKLHSPRIVVAYEPVWAIGTGLTPQRDEIAAMHGFIRERLKERLGGNGAGLRILYGGSVTPDNAAELLSTEDVDGALVGGASLAATSFMKIVSFYR